ncbi:MAG: alpha-mannosyltransferase [Bacillales bacterium]|jgi:glycosyltransferase involved in cell wall biosynthesis|nr:alpha-mannosyltransferase [Bacillales bacterium]
MNRILIVTDAWSPQINGVVNTLNNTIKELQDRGFEVFVIEPSMFDTFPLPFYKEISIVYHHTKKLNVLMENIKPNYIHIATEGPLGISARKYCVDKKLKFTTAYHTKFPEYAKDKLGVPLRVGYLYMKWFHRRSSNVMVATKSIKKELRINGISRVKYWSRGVDAELFSPEKKSNEFDFEYVLYVGRVSSEKNLDAFLGLDLSSIKPGLKKLVVGDGPQLEEFKEAYPDVVFVGPKKGEELATYYASAEVFCFPSKTDTFGLVMIESLASGVPVAAFSVPQIVDIINSNVGCTNQSLLEAIKIALKNKDSVTCRNYVMSKYTWQKATSDFLKNLTEVK